ncbi:MAG: aldehyde dehydrogenase family protein, partial [Opitutaceae bacterium]|nr:aldehyde dehydrogenase family protein [Opitutaceae bacterium]
MPTPLFIDGRPVVTATTFPVHAPYDGALLGEVCLGDRTHLAAAIDAAHRAFVTVTSRQAPYVRAELLARIAAALETHRATFIDLLIREAGKPRTFAEAEVTRAINTVQLSSELARETPGHLLDLDAFASGQHHFGLVRHFPLGVIYAVTPFNFPLNLVLHKLAPALATGNTVILKPSPRTPLIAAALVDLLHAAGLPAGQVNLVTCANADAAFPLADDRVKMLSFTGSAPVGWHLRSLCRSQKVVLELGGNAAAL